MSLAPRLALGSVQFGQPYGIANKDGQVSPSEVGKILNLAHAHGIKALDTAILYGNAEEILGFNCLERFSVVTKLPPLSRSIQSVRKWLISQIEGSLRRLRVNRIYGLLLHNPDDLLSDSGGDLFRAMEYVRNCGLVEKIGISVYFPQELDDIFQRFFLDIVQLPINVFDWRFFESGWIDKLGRLGVELHARSLFLQGLLLMPVDSLPSQFVRYQDFFAEFHSWALSSYSSEDYLLRACLHHVGSFDAIHRLVVGVDNSVQLSEILSAVQGSSVRVPSFFSSSDSRLVVPSKWQKI